MTSFQFLAVALSIALYIIAGGVITLMRIGRSDDLPLVVACCVVASLFLGWAFIEMKRLGAQPLTSLKPGRRYRVEGILPDLHGFRRERVARMVLSWHVDYGQYEFRVAYLDRDRLDRLPAVGDTLVGQHREYEGGMCYSVQPDPYDFCDLS